MYTNTKMLTNVRIRFEQSAESVDFIMSDFYHFYSYVLKEKKKYSDKL